MGVIIHKNQIQEGGSSERGLLLKGAALNWIIMVCVTVQSENWTKYILNQMRSGQEFCMMIVLARINTAKHDDSLIDLRGISFLLQIKSNFLLN